mmetsp:Transcript_28164/g.68345  ORF Transcript_28164/g.68345 Transcript_28164/m.68345 type:complete len:249 (-) Transcript_28164:4915-5661(-)
MCLVLPAVENKWSVNYLVALWCSVFLRAAGDHHFVSALFQFAGDSFFAFRELFGAQHCQQPLARDRGDVTTMAKYISSLIAYGCNRFLHRWRELRQLFQQSLWERCRRVHGCTVQPSIARCQRTLDLYLVPTEHAACAHKLFARRWRKRVRRVSPAERASALNVRGCVAARTNVVNGHHTLGNGRLKLDCVHGYLTGVVQLALRRPISFTVVNPDCVWTASHCTILNSTDALSRVPQLEESSALVAAD